MVEDLTVRDAMTTAYAGVSESDTVGDVIDMTLEEGVSEVVVLRGSEAVGTVTERDLLRAATTGSIPTEAGISSVMSGRGPSIDAETPLSEAASELSTADRRQLLVREGERIVGVLTSQDVITATASLLSAPEREADLSVGPGTDAESEATAENPEYTTQSVCEVCGSLMPNLASVNGQAVCGDCRGM